jgi:hypothetical protein
VQISKSSDSATSQVGVLETRDPEGIRADSKMTCLVVSLAFPPGSHLAPALSPKPVRGHGARTPAISVTRR